MVVDKPCMDCARIASARSRRKLKSANVFHTDVSTILPTVTMNKNMMTGDGARAAKT